MTDRNKDKALMVGCIVMGLIFMAVGTVFYVADPLMLWAMLVFDALGGFVIYQGVWTWLHNEALRKDLER